MLPKWINLKVLYICRKVTIRQIRFFHYFLYQQQFQHDIIMESLTFIYLTRDNFKNILVRLLVMFPAINS